MKKIEFGCTPHFVCHNCYQECVPKACYGCKTTVYCSEICQDEDFAKGHEYYCTQVAKSELKETSVQFVAADLMLPDRSGPNGGLKFSKMPMDRVFVGRYAPLKMILEQFGIPVFTIDLEQLTGPSKAQALKEPVGATAAGLVIVRFQHTASGGYASALEYLSRNRNSNAIAMAMECKRRMRKTAAVTNTAPESLNLPSVPTQLHGAPIQPAPHVPVVTNQVPRRPARYVNGHVPDLDSQVRAQKLLRTLGYSARITPQEAMNAILRTVSALCGVNLERPPNIVAQLAPVQTAVLKKNFLYAASAVDYEDYESAYTSLMAAAHVLVPLS